jgi:hypothetical protein
VLTGHLVGLEWLGNLEGECGCLFLEGLWESLLWDDDPE